MNKLIKLLYVNLLGLFDINKIIVARNDGVKSNLEKKSIIIGLMTIICGYLIYKVLIMVDIKDAYIYLNIGFFVSTLLCLFSNLTIIEPLLFRNDDNEVLFSLPLSRYQILFSKFFIVYIRNLIYTTVVMVAVLFSYTSYDYVIDDLFGLMFIVCIFIIPLLPIVLSTIIAYLNDFFKLKFNDSFLFRILKFILIIFIFIIIYYLFKNLFDYKDSAGNLLNYVDSRIKLIYPVTLLFEYALIKKNIIAFCVFVLFPIAVIYIYMLFITNNYLKMCSLLKGVKKNKKFVYKNVFNLHQFWGMIRKELLILWQNKIYFKFSIRGLIVFSIILFLILKFDFLSIFNSIDDFELYLYSYLPMILAMFVTLNNSSIVSYSLEKEHLQVIASLPVKMWKVFVSKFFSSVIIGFIFVVINGLLVCYYLDLNNWMKLYVFLIPFSALLFVSFSSTLLDYRFIEKNDRDDEKILSQRIISFVPMFLSLIIGIGPFFLPVYVNYKLSLGSYVMGFILLIVFEVFYLIINYKKLKSNLFN